MIDPIALTRDLVAIPSPSGQEAAVVDFMATVLERAGYQVLRHPVSPDRDVLYAVTEAPVVVLSTHLDVVPPHLEPAEDDEWLHGRGTCDAKGLAAAMVAAALRLREKGERRVGLLFVVGEEIGGDGARAANAIEPKGRYLINGEPTENQLSIGQKGAFAYEVVATGKAAHSAYPEEGDSAVETLLDAIERIRKLALPSDPLLGETTLNIGIIEGGVAANVIPAAAKAVLMYRTVSDVAPLEAAVREAAGPRVTVTRKFGFGHVLSPALPGWETTTVKFASDLAHLGPWGVGYQLGPGTIRVAHTAQERIRKADLLAGVDRYVSLAEQLIAADAASRGAQQPL